MNKLTKENIKGADYARIEPMASGYIVTLWRTDSSFPRYVMDKHGIMLFSSHLEAFKAVFKIRKDLPFRQYPTSTPSLPVAHSEPASTHKQLPSNHAYF